MRRRGGRARAARLPGQRPQPRLSRDQGRQERAPVLTDAVWQVSADGRLSAGGRTFRCALGKGGVRAEKREGDGATPVGRFALRRLLYRPDRMAPPETGLPAAALAPDDGWCDDPSDPAYNRPVKLPHPARHERMWREDHLYDLVVAIAHNDDPPVPHAGSAVFVHLARENYGPTEGCVALARDDLLWLLARADTSTVIEVRGD